MISRPDEKKSSCSSCLKCEVHLDWWCFRTPSSFISLQPFSKKKHAWNPVDENHEMAIRVSNPNNRLMTFSARVVCLVQRLVLHPPEEYFVTQLRILVLQEFHQEKRQETNDDEQPDEVEDESDDPYKHPSERRAGMQGNVWNVGNRPHYSEGMQSNVYNWVFNYYKVIIVSFFWGGGGELLKFEIVNWNIIFQATEKRQKKNRKHLPNSKVTNSTPHYDRKMHIIMIIIGMWEWDSGGKTTIVFP